MPVNRNPTIIDVAHAAGVSKSVVSRVVTGNGQVSPDARKKVEEAIAELGYSSNAAAQALTLGKTGNIGLLVRRSTSPYYGQLMFDLQEHAAQAGYRMIAVTGNLDTESESRALRTLLELRVDALVIGSGKLPTEQIQPVAAALPTVVIGRRAEGTLADVVRVDAEAQAKEAAALLKSSGHQHIGVITVPHSLSAEPRLDALLTVLRDQGFDVLEAEGSYDFPEATTATRALLRESKPPTAIISLSSEGAWAVLRECERQGLQAPRDVSILALDEPEQSHAFERTITTITHGGGKVASEAWRLLIERIGSPNLPARETLVAGGIVPGSTISAASKA